MAIDINQLALLGVGGVLVVMILAVLAQVGLSYLAQRNLNDQLSLGIQGIVGTNNLRTIDNQMDDRDGQGGNAVALRSGQDGGDSGAQGE
jgi:hypothetical protein